MPSDATKAFMDKFAELKDDPTKLKDLEHLDDERRDELLDRLERAKNERDPSEAARQLATTLLTLRQSVGYHVSRLEGVQVPDGVSRLAVYRSTGSEVLDTYFNVTRT